MIDNYHGVILYIVKRFLSFIRIFFYLYSEIKVKFEPKIFPCND